MRRHVTKSRLAFMAFAIILFAPALPAQAAGDPPGLDVDPVRIEVADLAIRDLWETYITVLNRTGERIQLDVVEVTEGSSHLSLSAYGCAGAMDDGFSCVVHFSARAYRPGIYRETLTIGTSDGRFKVVIPIRITAPDVNPPVMVYPTANASMKKAYLPPKRQARLWWVWGAHDDFGVTRFRTQMRIGDARWRRLDLPEAPTSGSSQGLPITVPTEKLVTIRTRAFDAWDNASDWSPLSVRVRYQNIVPADVVSGPWTVLRADGTYGGDLLVAHRRSCVVAITTTARGIYLLGRKGPQQGSVSLRADAGEWASQPLLTERPKDLRVIASFFWDTVGTHTITVDASVFPWRRRVSLDAWVIVE
jgi:hypothetical protein